MMGRAETGVRLPAPALTTTPFWEEWHVMAARNDSTSPRSNPSPHPESLPGEAWKPCPRHEGYEASGFGRVRSFWTRVGRLYEIGAEPRYLIPNGRRYLHVTLRTATGKRQHADVQCLVLEAFVGPRPPGLQACHADGNKHNNRLSNLRWDTPSANTLDKWDHGVMPAGESHGRAKLRIEDVREIRELAARGFTATTLAARHSIIRGKSWREQP